MALDKKLLDDLLDLFRVELAEKIQAITDRLLTLEKGARGKKRQQALEDIFRDAHGIKGAAQAVAVADVGEIAHHMESLFGALKNSGNRPPHDLIDVCLESLDRMQQAMEAFDKKRPLDFELAALLQRMDEQIKVADAGSKASPTGGAKTKRVADSDLATTIVEPTAVADEVSGADASKPKSGLIRISVDKLQGIGAQAEELQTAKIEMKDHLQAVGQLRDSLRSFSLEWKRSASDQAQIHSGAATAGEKSRDGRSEILEGLSAAAISLYGEMQSSTSQLHVLAEALQDQVRLIRLVPVATILTPLHRTVRDIARETDKTINFETSGDDIEMDRQLLDKLRDPLIHLLRNACDHGIESPDARRKSGKPATGSVGVAVVRQGNQIIITIEDDGAGIKVEDVLATAQRKKLLRGMQIESASPDEVLDLIFRPGYSSKEIITNVSGRGIGLDLVRANLRSVKGSVEVKTSEGEGTTFTIRLPLTVATDHGLMIRAGGAVCAIPATSVDRVLEIQRDDIVDVEASQALIVEERTIPLRALSDVLEVEAEEQDFSGSLSVVVVSRSWDAVAFLVDEVIGEREIVVKHFQPPLLSVRNVAGGTLTGSGEIIPVLNPADLVASGLRHGIRSHVVTTGEEVEEEVQPRILVVDDSITTRTLEKNILENFGYTVEVAVDGNEAWEQLQAQPFDLVITDIEMPEVDGFELTERIKQSAQFGDLPVVIVTSLAKETDKQRGIEVGADAYIVKQQFETRALLDVIGQIV